MYTIQNAVTYCITYSSEEIAVIFTRFYADLWNNIAILVFFEKVVKFINVLFQFDLMRRRKDRKGGGIQSVQTLPRPTNSGASTL
jgi:hypothetical protein